MVHQHLNAIPFGGIKSGRRYDLLDAIQLFCERLILLCTDGQLVDKIKHSAFYARKCDGHPTDGGCKLFWECRIRKGTDSAQEASLTPVSLK